MMIRLLAPVAPLLVGVAILLIGQGLQGTLLPLRANLEGFSTLTIGLMGGAYFLGFTLGCLRGSNLVRRVGHVRCFAAFAAVGAAASLGFGLLVHPAIWLLLLPENSSSPSTTMSISCELSYSKPLSPKAENQTSSDRVATPAISTKVSCVVIVVSPCVVIVPAAPG